MHVLLDAFFAQTTEHVHRYEGTINQFLGDGFMALFGAPIAHEDHARRAVHAALALRDAVAEDARLGDVELRFGLNSGTVIVGAIGDDLRMDYTAFGDTTILAARLQAAAAPGEVLLSGATADAVRGYFETTPADSVVVKERTVRPVRVVGIGTRRSRLQEPDRRLAPFVGRARELELLDDARERMAAGEGTIVGVVGEPGLGKSRLIHEFVQRIDSATTSTYEGRCVSYGATIPYVPVIDLLRATAHTSLTDTRAAERITAALEEAGVEPEAARPFLLQLLGDADAMRLLAGVDPASVKGRTFEILRELWLGLARRQPLVLVLEDLHWIDRTSEQFFGELADEIAAAPILLVANYRPGYDPPWSGKSFATQLALRPLGEGESRKLVDFAASVPDDIADAIVARGEGNPFFLEELTRAATEQREDAVAPVPTTVQDVLAARIDRLGEASKRAVQTASVLGREFTLPLLAALWDDGSDLKTQLQELKRLELLFERRLGETQTFVFKHALTQEVAYDSLLESRRREVHGRAGRAIEELYADRLDEQYELLAYHYARSDDRGKAVDYLVLANRKAAAGNAMEEAIGYFYEALSTLEALPDTRENHTRRVELVFDQTGEFHFLHRHREYYDLIVRHEPLVEELGDERLLGSFLARLGHRLWTFGEFEDARDTVERAIELCERCGNVVDAAGAHAILAWTHLQLGDLGKVRPECERALEKLDESFHPVWYSFTRCAALLADAWEGRFEAAAYEAGEATRVGTARSDPAIISFNRGFLAYAYLQQRDWARALDEAQVSIEVAPTVYFRVFPQTFLAAALCQMGDAEQGFAILDAIEPLVRSSEHWAAWMVVAVTRAEASLLSGDIDRAAAALPELAERAKRSRGAIWIAQTQRLLAECALLNDVGDAASPVARAIEISRATGMENELALALAVDGRRLRKLGDAASARARFEEALTIFDRLGTLVEPDRVRAELAVDTVR